MNEFQMADVMISTSFGQDIDLFNKAANYVGHAAVRYRASNVRTAMFVRRLLFIPSPIYEMICLFKETQSVIYRPMRLTTYNCHSNELAFECCGLRGLLWT